MALVWLLGAMASSAIGGLFVGHAAVWSIFVSFPFIFAAGIGYLMAAGWWVSERPVGGRDQATRSRPEPLEKSRIWLGVLVGVAAMLWSFGYAATHQAWFGDRVTAIVADSERRCGGESGCGNVYRLTDRSAGDDLGWMGLCGERPFVGDPVAVDVDPLGWVEPIPAACSNQRSISAWFTYVWLAGVGLLLTARAAAAVRLWRRD